MNYGYKIPFNRIINHCALFCPKISLHSHGFISRSELTVDHITNVTSGRRQSAGGFLWKRCEANSPIENISPPTTVDITGKTIFQVDSNGEVIGEFSTLRMAAERSGVNRKSIRDVINGRQKTAGGFYWAV